MKKLLLVGALASALLSTTQMFGLVDVISKNKKGFFDRKMQEVVDRAKSFECYKTNKKNISDRQHFFVNKTHEKVPANFCHACSRKGTFTRNPYVQVGIHNKVANRTVWIGCDKNTPEIQLVNEYLPLG